MSLEIPDTKVWMRITLPSGEKRLIRRDRFNRIYDAFVKMFTQAETLAGIERPESPEGENSTRTLPISNRRED